MEERKEEERKEEREREEGAETRHLKIISWYPLFATVLLVPEF